MPHLHRFYIGPEGAGRDVIALPADEAHHALRVVRVREGESVECFDGRGGVWEGVFRPEGGKAARVEIAGHRQDAGPALRLTLLQAWLHRPKAIEELLRRGTEIGVSRFVFFKAARSERAPKRSGKWDKILVEVCKQSGRNRLPEIAIADDGMGVLADEAGTKVVASMDPAASAAGDIAAGGEVTLVVGPEGDFTPEEYGAIASTGALPMTLGAYTYRAEVAAVLGATLLLHEAGGFGG